MAKTEQALRGVALGAKRGSISLHLRFVLKGFLSHLIARKDVNRVK